MDQLNSLLLKYKDSFLEDYAAQIAKMKEAQKPLNEPSNSISPARGIDKKKSLL